MRRKAFSASAPLTGPNDFITVKRAVERGYASRHTLMRWAKDGSVRSYVRGRNRYVSEGDVRARLAQRQTGVRTVTGEELANRLVSEIAGAAPALNEAQRERLVALLERKR